MENNVHEEHLGTVTLERRTPLGIGVPLLVSIDGHPVGIMRGKSLSIRIPHGEFCFKVCIPMRLWKWEFQISGKEDIEVIRNMDRHFLVTDNETVWNTLFNIDLVLWLMTFFISVPSPWNILYEVLSNGFFVIWLFRLWIRRDRYYKFRIISHQLDK